ncbi:MAG: amidohydrolase [Marinoscillum sp.]
MSENIVDDAIALRKHLHQHPEISCEEQETSKLLKKKLEEECAPDDLITFDQYGLAAIYKGSSHGKTIMIRGDFDALPIQEINDFDHKSIYDGVSHKCGHDGHASILYALARTYKDSRPDQGTVILLFQPAEENGEGAKGIINDPKFDFNPDYVVALHNLPGYEKHSIVWKKDTFTAAANSLIIKLFGKTSHAAEPELGVNPALAMAEITRKTLELNVEDLENPKFKIATPIYTTMGEKSYGVSAGYGELHFTLRAWDNEVIQDFEEQCESLAHEVGKEYGLNVKTTWTQSFFANNNDHDIIDAVKKVAKDLDLKTEERKSPFKWGEDFGIFTEKFPGAMFGIGSGLDCPALHNPDYDFPDEILETAMKVFHGVAIELQRD